MSVCINQIQELEITLKNYGCELYGSKVARMH